MTAELTCRLNIVMNRPYIELIVITTWGKLLFIVRPFESTHLLLVTLQAPEVIIWLSQVSLQNCLVLWTRAKHTWAPCYSPYSAFMTLESSHKLALVNVPNLDCSTVCAYRQVLPSLGPADRRHLISRPKVMKLSYFAVACRPDVDTVWETYSKIVGRWPIYKIEVEIILKSWSIENFVRNLWNLAGAFARYYYSVLVKSRKRMVLVTSP